MWKSSTRICWVTIAFLTLALAYVVSVARLYFPLFEQYRSVVETWATNELKRPVQVAEITAGWAGLLQPRLRIKKVIVRTEDNSREWIKFDEVQIYFRPLESVQNWRVVPGKVNVVGAEIDVEYKNKNFYVGGVKFDNRHGVGHSRLLQWLISREKLIVSNSRVNLKDPRISRELLKLRNIDFLLSFKPSDYHVSGAFRLQRQHESEFYFIGNLKGDFLKFKQMQQQFYFSGSAQIGSWLNKKLLANTDVKDGVIDFRLWGDGIGKISKVLGQFDIDDIKWTREVVTRSATGLHVIHRPFELEKLSANFNWLLRSKGWDLLLNDLRWISKGQAWPASELNVRYDYNKQGQTLKGSASFFRIEDVGQLLLSILPVQNVFREKLRVVKPVGDIKNLVFELSSKNNQIDNYYVNFEFDRIGINGPYGGLGLDNFRGKVAANPNGGYFRLNNKQSSFYFSKLFNNSLPLTQLNGDVIWRYGKKGFVIKSDKLVIANQDVKSITKFSYKKNKSGEDYLNIKSSFSKGNKHSISRYLPRKIMKPKLLVWLDHALIGGSVTGGSLVYQGVPAQFPFENGKGRFRVKFDFHDMKFRFHRLWPAINNLHASMDFHGKALTVKMHSGILAGLELLPTDVKLSSLDKNSKLSLSGSIIGATNDLIKFIAAIPARNNKNHFLHNFEAKGNSITSLKLNFPLFNIVERSYAGEVQLFDSNLIYKNLNINLKELNGKLSYSNVGPFLHINSDKIEGKYRDQPVVFSIKNSGLRDNLVLTTDLRMRARMSLIDLLGDFGEPLIGTVQGVSDWITGLEVKQYEKHPPRVSFILESQLQGVKVILPGAFAKSQEKQRRFFIKADISQNTLGAISLQYGKLVSSIFRLKKQRGHFIVDSGEVKLGGGKAGMPNKQGIRLSGNLSRFSVSEWTKWAEQKKLSGDNSYNLLNQVKSLNVKFKQLELVSNKIHHVTIRAERKAKYWHAFIDGNEIEGNMRIPLTINKRNALNIELQRLSLTESDTDKKRSLPDPRLLPPIKVHSKKFYYNGINHGELKLSALAVKHGLQFDEFSLLSKYLKINATGSWLYNDGMHSSAFKINATSDDVGKALAYRDYDVNFKRGSAVIDIDAHWQGPPAYFELKVLNGSMAIEIKKGRVLSIKSGGARILGMFSLQALPRRLALDFRDVFKKGFSFDVISGSFVLSNGDAYTNSLVVDSPAAKIEIAGRLGLANRDYDQTIYVTPKVSSNLPIVGGIAGGPTVGIGMWVADKVLGKQINKTVTRRYNLEGTWDKPIINKLDRKGKAVIEDPSDFQH